MIILSLKTDQPEAEIGLFEDHKQLKYETWLAHRQLSDTLLTKINHLLQGDSLQKAQRRLGGIVVFQGPGSFTGLRIGLTVANTISYSFGVPIIGCRGEDWLKSGIDKLLAGENEAQVLPFYGAEPNITKPRK